MMRRAVVVGAFLICAKGVCADICPDFFRFVDFGLQDRNGTFLRGGVLLRAEGLNGATLVSSGQTVCRDVQDIARDGHGNPIPVVHSLAYDADRLDIDVSELQVSFAIDSRVAAEQAAKPHQDHLATAARRQVRGLTSLCSVSTQSRALSCQLVSPYPGNVALVVYCDEATCHMPSLAIHPQILVEAKWEAPDLDWENPQQFGPSLSAKVRSIHTFLKPLTSGL
ncbi:MAG: hypothetical protein AB8B71_10875 [Paracoccaceae bacterium]